MKRIIAGAVAAVVVVIGVVLFALPAWRSSSFHAALPAIPPAPPLPALTVPTSTIIVPIEVRLDGIARALNARVRRGDAERQANFARDLLRDDHVEYSWQRGDFALGAADGSLTLAAPLSGRLVAQ